VVSRTATCLSVLLLTEDSGTKSFETLRSVARELLKQADEYVQTHRISFEPLRNELALQAIHANIWKSTKARDRPKQVELIRTIATQVMLEDGWVLFHFDGDRTWAARETSENMEKFQKQVWERVRELVGSTLAKSQSGSTLQEAEARARARMARLKTVVPFYSMEAWLFQNTREAVRLCQEHYQGRDVSKFQEWAQDRTALDEVDQPKKKTCLGAAHNHDLASNGGFPAREVRAAGKSFAATVESLLQDAELREALARTYSLE
jgi:hypothetical protein